MGPHVAVDGVVPVTSARGCTSWNGTPCCPGVVPTLLVNVATSGVGRSFGVPVCGGPAWGDTGARVAMEVAGCCHGTSRGRLLAGSRAVNCSRELKNCLTSSSENSWVAPFDGLGRAFRGSTGTEQ